MHRRIIPTLIIATGLAGSLPAAAQAPDEPPPLEVELDSEADVELMQPAEIALSSDELDEDDDEEVASEVTLDGFKRVLSPHGRWVSTPEYGLVWIPTVDPLWRPYTYGEWAYTSAGWTFISYDSWGWAPFHYGRWVYKRRLGWCWIPGYQWAPAWVTWRYGGGYVAWAPLGPAGVRVSYYSTPSLWIAVQTGFFGRPLVRRHFVPTRRIGVVFRTTKFAGVHRHRVIGGPSTTYVTRATGRPVRRIARRHAAPRWVERGTFRSPVVRRRPRAAPAVKPHRGQPVRRVHPARPRVKPQKKRRIERANPAPKRPHLKPQKKRRTEPAHPAPKRGKKPEKSRRKARRR